MGQQQLGGHPSPRAFRHPFSPVRFCATHPRRRLFLPGSAWSPGRRRSSHRRAGWGHTRSGRCSSPSGYTACWAESERSAGCCLQVDKGEKGVAVTQTHSRSRGHGLGKPHPENGSPLGPNRSKTGRRREGRGRRARLPRCRCQRGVPQTGPRGPTAETLPPARTPAHRHSGQAFGQGPVLTAEGGRAGSTRSLHEVLPTKAERSAKQLSVAHRLRALRRRWHHPRVKPTGKKKPQRSFCNPARRGLVVPTASSQPSPGPQPGPLPAAVLSVRLGVPAVCDWSFPTRSTTLHTEDALLGPASHPRREMPT